VTHTVTHADQNAVGGGGVENRRLADRA
jgi:hypothetical protein